MNNNTNVTLAGYFLIILFFAYSIFIKGFSPLYFIACFLLLGVAKALNNE